MNLHFILTYLITKQLLTIYQIKNAYLIAMSMLIEEKNKKYTDLEMILHSDQGSVYCSKRFNESLYLYNIIHSVSKPGSPTENGAMEAING